MPSVRLNRPSRVLLAAALACSAAAGCTPTRELPFVRPDGQARHFRHLWRYPARNTPAAEWDGQIPAFETSAPVLDHDTLFLSFGLLRRLAAVDPATGRERWTLEAAQSLEGQGTVHEGRLYVGTSDGQVLCLEAATGTQVWRYEDRKEFTAPPAVSSEGVFVVATDDTVIALDAATGSPLWRHEPGYAVDLAYRRSAGPVVREGRIFVTTVRGDLLTLDARSGEIEMSLHLHDELEKLSDLNLVPMFADGRVLLNTREGLWARDEDKGRWEEWYDLASTEPPWITADAIYLTTRLGRVAKIDPVHHETVWETDLGEAYLTSPVEVGRIFIAVGSWEGGLYLIHKNSGRVVEQFMPDVRVTAAPVADGSNLYVRSHLGTVYALRFQPPL
ncbi:MAG: PQQ-binding-like beta-propeller repeat protein [Nitrospirae bacterium]|nr:PQQ-binding-like beta-propeller repeat protein [Nitrospirota bacterium]